MKKNNKIILSALISSLFAFNASAITSVEEGNYNVTNPNTGMMPFPPYFPSDAPKEITDPSYRLSYQAVKPTVVRLKSLYSSTDYVVVKMTHNYWDPDSNTIKEGKAFEGGMYLNGDFTSVTLPDYATQVIIKLTDQMSKPLPGMQEMKLCVYKNPITILDAPTTPGNSQIDIAFIKNDKNQLDGKIGLPTDEAEIFYSKLHRFGECK